MRRKPRSFLRSKRQSWHILKKRLRRPSCAWCGYDHSCTFHTSLHTYIHACLRTCLHTCPYIQYLLSVPVLNTRGSISSEHQEAEGLIRKGAGLTMDDICLLVQYWKLDVKLDALPASNLTLQTILGMKRVTLRHRLACTYGTTVALVAFLRKLVEGTLSPPRTGSTQLLDQALHRANCMSIRPQLIEEGVSDDVLFEIDLENLGAIHGTIADHLPDLEAAVRGLRSERGTSVESGLGSSLLGAAGP
eukprot:m.67574 g.67574  ORF g.67574 m.67574 type:complete len:247 (+) comp49980_c0_seq3:742-1482(+)